MRLTEWGDRPNAWPSSEWVEAGTCFSIFHGVKHVDGYEINRTMIDFLQRDFRDFNAVTTRPEVRLIHDDARNGIAHSGQQCDVIQASLIDTWRRPRAADSCCRKTRSTRARDGVSSSNT